MKTAEEYAFRFLPTDNSHLVDRKELMELIRQVQQDSKDEWIERCAEKLHLLVKNVRDMQFKHIKDAVAVLALNTEIITIKSCMSAILSLKTEHPDKGVI